MDDTNVEQQGTTRRLTWLWAILAIVSVGGFLVWLGATAEPTQLTAVEEEEEDPSIPTVSVDTFAEETETYTGLEIRLRDMPVAGLLGTQLFWTQIPAEDEGMTTPFLMRLDSTLVADSVVVETGDEVTVVGRVFPVSETLLTNWVETGVISEDERIEAEFATAFMEVTDLRSGTSDDGGADSGGDAGDDADGDADDG